MRSVTWGDGYLWYSARWFAWNSTTDDFPIQTPRFFKFKLGFSVATFDDWRVNPLKYPMKSPWNPLKSSLPLFWSKVISWIKSPFPVNPAQLLPSSQVCVTNGVEVRASAIYMPEHQAGECFFSLKWWNISNNMGIYHGNIMEILWTYDDSWIYIYIYMYIIYRYEYINGGFLSHGDTQSLEHFRIETHGLWES